MKPHQQVGKLKPDVRVKFAQDYFSYKLAP